MKRSCALGLLLLLLPVFALAEGYARIFDTSDDAGKLTARFISMDTGTGEKAGDCAVLTSPDGLVMVIDAGHPDAAGDIVRALDAMGVKDIDLLVLSHPHIDHVGGMPELLRKFRVRTAYSSFLDYPSAQSLAFLAALEEKDVPLVRLKRGDVLPFGKEVRVSILFPGPEIAYYDGYPEGSTQFINNLSLVMMLEFRGTRMLFSGDLYSLGEKEVMALGDDLRADVFKVNHHGDDTSSSKAWRAAVLPKVAVITHNALADLRIPRKFKEEGTRVLHTFMDGSIRVSSPGEGILEVLTEKDRGGGKF